MLAKLHAKLGDFWWYSLMLFCACRAADVLNAFVGLWLVPKYVDPSELGAVMPLTQFANFLAIPIAAFANTFRNEVSRLSINKEFGKLKTLMRSVFITTAIFLFLATVVAHFILPSFLERIRIAEGSLTIIIITTSSVSAAAPIYSHALQALKKFKEQSLLSIIGAPIRLITMLIAMPFRAITGYFVGQASTPIFNIAATIISLRKELSVKATPYWHKNIIRQFTKIFIIFLSWSLSGGFCALIETMILRQRLPDAESAGYYIATRFSELTGFLATTLSFTIFPFAAENAALKKDSRPMIIKSTVAVLFFSTPIAVLFFIFGETILSFLPNGEQYVNFMWVIPWTIGINVLSAFNGLYTTTEVAANKFSFLKWMIPIEIIYPILLLLVTEHGYFINLIPAQYSESLSTYNIYSLNTMLWWMTGIGTIKSIACLLSMTHNRTR